MATKRGTMRTTLRVATIVLVIMTIGCVVLLIVSPKSLLETTVEVVSLVTGAMALGIAIVSQVAANREEKRLRSIIADLHNIIRETNRELKFDRKVELKLDEILELEHKRGQVLSRKNKKIKQ